MSEFQKQVNIDLPKPSKDLPAATVIRARDFEVACPKCGHFAEGWAVDPRGRTDKCEECETEYRIPGDVPISFF